MTKDLRRRVSKLLGNSSLRESIVPPEVLARRQAYAIEITRWFSMPPGERGPRPLPLDPSLADPEDLRAVEKLRSGMEARGIKILRD